MLSETLAVACKAKSNSSEVFLVNAMVTVPDSKYSPLTAVPVTKNVLDVFPSVAKPLA